MNKKALLERVKKRSYKRYRFRVERRMLSDWVNEDLVPQAVALGRTSECPRQNWDWNAGHYRRILQICRIMGGGITRKTGVYIELWLRGIEIPFDLLPKSFSEEFKRLRQKRLKPVNSNFDLATENMTTKRKKALANQMGELSPELNIELSNEEKIKMLQGVAAEDAKIDVTFYAPKLIDNMGLGEVKQPYLAMFGGLLNTVALGLFTDPDYEKNKNNSAQTVIGNSDKAAFESARQLFWIFQWALSHMAPLIKQLAPENSGNIEIINSKYNYISQRIKSGSGRLEFFITLLSLISRDPEKAQIIQNSIRSIMPRP